MVLKGDEEMKLTLKALRVNSNLTQEVKEKIVKLLNLF